MNDADNHECCACAEAAPIRLASIGWGVTGKLLLVLMIVQSLGLILDRVSWALFMAWWCGSNLPCDRFWW